MVEIYLVAPVRKIAYIYTLFVVAAAASGVGAWRPSY